MSRARPEARFEQLVRDYGRACAEHEAARQNERVPARIRQKADEEERMLALVVRAWDETWEEGRRNRQWADRHDALNRATSNRV